MPRKIRRTPRTTPRPELQEIDLLRPFPSYDCLTRKKDIKDLDTIVVDLDDFMKHAKIPHHTVNYVAEKISGRPGFEEFDLLQEAASKKEKYFISDPWEQRSMAIIREGQRPITDGFHMLIAHIDSPCLRVKTAPIRREWDLDLISNHLGVRLSCFAYGGIPLHGWAGQPVKVLGYSINDKNEKSEIEFDAVTQDVAVHVDDRDDLKFSEAFPHEETLELITGWSVPGEAREALGFSKGNEGDDEFGNTRLWAVSRQDPIYYDAVSWRLFTNQGLDNKVSVFASYKAISNYFRIKPEYTSIVWLPDNEEIGDIGNTGAKGPFVEHVINWIIEKQRRHGKLRRKNLTKVHIDRMYMNSSVLIADVDIAPWGHDSHKMDYFEAPKIGSGVFLFATDGQEYSISSSFIKKLQNISNGKRSPICHQVSGTSYKGENLFGEGAGEWNNGYLINKGVSWTNSGVPLAGMHTSGETVCTSDVLWTSRFYKRFLESNISLR